MTTSRRLPPPSLGHTPRKKIKIRRRTKRETLIRMSAFGALIQKEEERILAGKPMYDTGLPLSKRQAAFEAMYRRSHAEIERLNRELGWYYNEYGEFVHRDWVQEAQRGPLAPARYPRQARRPQPAMQSMPTSKPHRLARANPGNNGDDGGSGGGGGDGSLLSILEEAALPSKEALVRRLEDIEQAEEEAYAELRRRAAIISGSTGGDSGEMARQALLAAQAAEGKLFAARVEDAIEKAKKEEERRAAEAAAAEAAAEAARKEAETYYRFYRTFSEESIKRAKELTYASTLGAESAKKEAEARLKDPEYWADPLKYKRTKPYVVNHLVWVGGKGKLWSRAFGAPVHKRVVVLKTRQKLNKDGSVTETYSIEEEIFSADIEFAMELEPIRGGGDNGWLLKRLRIDGTEVDLTRFDVSVENVLPSDVQQMREEHESYGRGKRRPGYTERQEIAEAKAAKQPIPKVDDELGISVAFKPDTAMLHLFIRNPELTDDEAASLTPEEILERQTPKVRCYHCSVDIPDSVIQEDRLNKVAKYYRERRIARRKDPKFQPIAALLDPMDWMGPPPSTAVDLYDYLVTYGKDRNYVHPVVASDPSFKDKEAKKAYSVARSALWAMVTLLQEEYAIQQKERAEEAKSVQDILSAPDATVPSGEVFVIDYDEVTAGNPNAGQILPCPMCNGTKVADAEAITFLIGSTKFSKIDGPIKTMLTGRKMFFTAIFRGDAGNAAIGLGKMSNHELFMTLAEYNLLDPDEYDRSKTEKPKKFPRREDMIAALRYEIPMLIEEMAEWVNSGKGTAANLGLDITNDTYTEIVEPPDPELSDDVYGSDEPMLPEEDEDYDLEHLAGLDEREAVASPVQPVPPAQTVEPIPLPAALQVPVTEQVSQGDRPIELAEPAEPSKPFIGFPVPRLPAMGPFTEYPAGSQFPLISTPYGKPMRALFQFALSTDENGVTHSIAYHNVGELSTVGPFWSYRDRNRVFRTPYLEKNANSKREVRMRFSPPLGSGVHTAVFMIEDDTTAGLNVPQYTEWPGLAYSYIFIPSAKTAPVIAVRPAPIDTSKMVTPNIPPSMPQSIEALLEYVGIEGANGYVNSYRMYTGPLTIEAGNWRFFHANTGTVLRTPYLEKSSASTRRVQMRFDPPAHGGIILAHLMLIGVTNQALNVPEYTG